MPNKVYKLIQRLQRSVCVIVSGAVRTTPTSALEIIMDHFPLDLFCRGSGKEVKESPLPDLLGWGPFSSVDQIAAVDVSSLRQNRLFFEVYCSLITATLTSCSLTICDSKEKATFPLSKYIHNWPLQPFSQDY